MHSTRFLNPRSLEDYSEIITNENASIGHLPFFGFFEQAWRVKVLGVWEWHSAIATASWWRLCVALFSRLESCQVKGSRGKVIYRSPPYPIPHSQLRITRFVVLALA
ncbi:MAG: hypothetical protein KME21_16525 [Desmonostoc vinosum HA7617-LM4]|jgi:hypothetical protein|nr:hypothetical protein [Desmonostoc vinosum HA7617-LM4]